jgi:hypothetical protein
MNLSHDGLTLWYGTPDTPAPASEEVIARRGVSIVVGAHPYNPLNSVRICYRVDDGLTHTLPGREIRVDYARNAQYFAVIFPTLITGEGVEYGVTLQCGGRQVPAPQLATRLRSRFRLEPKLRAATRHGARA